MEPAQRKVYVRGIIGVGENHYLLNRMANVERLILGSLYLYRYSRRRP
jgi:hypothetical protein